MIRRLWNPARRPGEIIRIRFAEFPLQRRLFVKHDEEVLPADNYRGVENQRWGTEKPGLTEQRYQDTDIHRVSDVAVKSPRDQVFWRINRRRRPFASRGEIPGAFEIDRQANRQWNQADELKRPKMRERRRVSRQQQIWNQRDDRARHNNREDQCFEPDHTNLRKIKSDSSASANRPQQIDRAGQQKRS